jgi:small subunit ribosomal protein S17
MPSNINNHKTFKGTVVSTKMDKTITVLVEYFKTDRIYKKRIKQSKKFHAHDENNLAKNGDIVTIIETRPFSKTVSYRLLTVNQAYLPSTPSSEASK